MMKKILFILFMLFIVSFVSAESFVFEKGECARLKQTCANCTSINITSVDFPNSTQAIDFSPMTKNGTEYNFTFCSTYDSGTYIVSGIGDVDGVPTIFAYDFNVTPSGKILQNGEVTVYIIFLIIMFFLFILCLYASIKLPYENEKEMTREGPAVTRIVKTKYAKLMFIWISYGLFLYMITIIAGITNNYIFFEPLTDMSMNLYYYFSVGGYIVSFAMVWFIFANIWKDIVLNKKILKEGRALLNSL